MATNIKFVLLLCLPLLCCLVEGHGGHRIARPPATVFNVKTYGAIPDGKTESTQAFQEAWRAACNFNGNARVLIPKGVYLLGQTTFEGPCKSPLPITVQLKGTVKATIDTSKYTHAEWFTFEKINGFRLNGGGTFNGQGAAVWGKHSCSETSKCATSAVNLKFRNITNGKIGRITSLNPKGFHMCVNNCHRFIAKAISIIAPADSPNTDGIHISSSSDVTISKSIISTGDDCISIIQGDNRISVSEVTCGPGHGISVGSLGKYENEKDVRSVFVRNCTLINTKNGVRVKSWRGATPSAASDIHFDDIVMQNVNNPVVIDQEYCASGKNCRGNLPSKVKLSNIHFRNIRGTTNTQCAVKMKCSPLFPCENVEVHDINLKYAGGFSQALPALSECSNVKVGAFGIQFPPPCL